ncbi:hypothetical protein D3C74_394240 [compost metagenome]
MPAQILRNDAPYRRSERCRQPLGSPEQGQRHSSFFQRDGTDANNHTARNEAGRTDPLHETENNQIYSAVGQSAQGGTQTKYHKAGHKKLMFTEKVSKPGHRDGEHSDCHGIDVQHPGARFKSGMQVLLNGGQRDVHNCRIQHANKNP